MITYFKCASGPHKRISSPDEFDKVGVKVFRPGDPEFAAAKADEKAKKAEKARKLAEAKCKTASDALQRILDIANDTSLDGLYRIDMIRDVAEANI